MATAELRASAIQTLQQWSPPDADQEQLRDEVLAYLASHEDGLSRSCRPDHLTASAIVIDQAGEHVALGLHRKVGLWLQFGGHIESNDSSLLTAATRETIEESGLGALEFEPKPLRIDRHAAPCGARYHLDVQFVARAALDESPVASDESLDVRWFAVDHLPIDTDQAVRTLIDAAVKTTLR